MDSEPTSTQEQPQKLSEALVNLDPDPKLVFTLTPNLPAPIYENPASALFRQQLVDEGFFTQDTWELIHQSLSQENREKLTFNRIFIDKNGLHKLVKWTAVRQTDHVFLFGNDITDSIMDTATGVYNHNYYEAYKDTHHGPIRQPTALVYADANNLKLANDIYGHDVGDQLLKTIAIFLRSLSREDDTLCRVGGDEFVLILENIQKENLSLISDRLTDIFSVISANSYDPENLSTELLDYDIFFKRFYAKLKESGIDLDQVYQAKKIEGLSVVSPSITLRELFSLSIGLYAADTDDDISISELATEAEKKMSLQKDKSKLLLDPQTAEARLKSIISPN